MAKAKSSTEGPSVLRDERIALPTKAPVPQTRGRVQTVRQSERESGAGKRTMPGREAATLSELFPAGGAAFERWLRDEGINPAEFRTQAEWQPLVEKFAARPIHGHRRGPDGGNHRAR